VAVCVVAALGLLCIHWPLVSDPASLKFFGISDAWVYTGAALFYSDHSLHAGEFPLWNPLVFCGQPISGNPQFLLFYPPNLLRSLLTLNPTPWKTAAGLAFLAFAHGVLAALGGYAFGRFRGLSRAGAAFAGIAFALSSAYLQRFFLHHHMVFVVAWLPWDLLAIDWAGRARSARESIGRYTAAGAVFALTILAGSPELTYFVAIAMVLYWFVARAARLVAERSAAGLQRDVYGGTISIVVALALSAMLVFPALEFIQNTQRVENPSQRIEVSPSVESASLREALLFYPGGETHEGIKGIGASAAILCVLGLFSPLRREAIVFAIVGATLVGSSQVDSIVMHRVIGGLAPFPISSPGRLSLVAALPLSILAALGVDRLRIPFDSRASRLFATGVCLAFTLVVLETLYSYSLTAGRFMGVPILRALVFPAGAGLAALSCIWFPGRRWMAALAAGLALLEPLYWQSVKIRALSERPELFATNSGEAAHDYGRMWLGNHRDSLLMPNSALYALQGQINGYDPLVLSAYRQLAGPPTVDPFWRGEVEVGRWSDRPYLLMKRTFWLQRQYVSGEIPPRGQKFPVTTTAFLTDPPDLHVPETNADSVGPRPYSDDAVRKLLLTSPIELRSSGTLDEIKAVLLAPQELPQLHPTLHLRVSCDRSAVLTARLPELEEVRAATVVAEITLEPETIDKEFDIPLPDAGYGRIEFAASFPSGAGTLSINAAELILDASDEDALIEVVNRSANCVEVEVKDLPDYRVLSYIDFAYPGWHVYVDGAEAPLLTAFSYFKGVEVPPGTHRVRFVYRPVVTYAGIATSIMALLVACIVVALTLIRRRAA
jgi:hypothetical protein